MRAVWPYYLLFFVSGFSALLYQIASERALFTPYGVNIRRLVLDLNKEKDRSRLDWILGLLTTRPLNHNIQGDEIERARNY